MQENEHKLEVFYEELDPLRGCTSSWYVLGVVHTALS